MVFENKVIIVQIFLVSCVVFFLFFFGENDLMLVEKGRYSVVIRRDQGYLIILLIDFIFYFDWWFEGLLLKTFSKSMKILLRYFVF